MEKHIWEITLDDLRESPTWYYKHCVDSDYDETILSPAPDELLNDPNVLAIAYTIFFDSEGTEFQGYVHLGEPELSHSQPCLFLGDTAVTFWYGIAVPAREDLPLISFPLNASTIEHPEVESMSFDINGFGYINDEGAIVEVRR